MLISVYRHIQGWTAYILEVQPWHFNPPSVAHLCQAVDLNWIWAGSMQVIRAGNILYKVGRLFAGGYHLSQPGCRSG